MSDSSGAGGGALSVLATGAAALTRAGDLDTTLATLLASACDATGAAAAAVFAQDQDRPDVSLLAVHGMSGDTADGLAAEVQGDGAHPIRRAAGDRTDTLGRAATRTDGRPVTAADLALVAERGGIEAQVGVVSFWWEGAHELSGDEATLLRAVADLVTVAVAGARTAAAAAERAEWFERLAQTDPLTGLANARTLSRVLELEVARASRQGSEVSVAVFDVDGFGAVNAAAGTRAGDRILREVAAVLAESVRLVDTIARTGGDEFALVAPGSAGMTVARRVIDGIARLEAVEGQRIAVSAGVARFPGDGTDTEALLDAARGALDAARSARAPVAEATTAPSEA